MRMNEISFEGAPPIDSYFEGGFRIAGEIRQGSALIIGSELLEWPVVAPGDLEVSHCHPLLDRRDQFDVLLIGMGANIAALPNALREALEGAGIGAEIMSTPSACRTYNVLLSEGRRVAVALIAMPPAD